MLYSEFSRESSRPFQFTFTFIVIADNLRHNNPSKSTFQRQAKLFSEGASRMMYIEDIARMAGIRKAGDVGEYQRTPRNGSGELLEDQ
jgi:hypothetical protein